MTYPIIHRTLEQRSEEWFKAREKKMTASNAQAIGNAGKGMDTYIYKLMASYYSTRVSEGFDNEHTQRGVELEPIARDIYELETGVITEEVGFIEYSEFVGGSPDGLVSDNGIIEVKCLDDTKHFKVLLHGEKAIDSAYKWQMQMLIFITGREWCDYVGYNPNFGNDSLYIKRFFPDPDMHEKLLNGFEKGKDLITKIIQSYEQR